MKNLRNSTEGTIMTYNKHEHGKMREAIFYFMLRNYGMDWTEDGQTILEKMGIKLTNYTRFSEFKNAFLVETKYDSNSGREVFRLLKKEYDPKLFTSDAMRARKLLRRGTNETEQLCLEIGKLLFNNMNDKERTADEAFRACNILGTYMKNYKETGNKDKFDMNLKMLKKLFGE